eukprot:2002793-Amphidinium_carterae.1
MDELPPHLQLVSNAFRQYYTCNRCKAYTGVQARSQFFQTHWHCEGVNPEAKRSRHFLRKASLAENQQRVPGPSDILSLEWYQSVGQLPPCILQENNG